MKKTHSNKTLSDPEARERALDPRTSFIVQAPAGSGKTELLTQRFLVLLNHVNSPEEILAITFTKKSANEMRARIINTLKMTSQTHEEPEQHHKKKTWILAKQVLTRDKQLEWNLLANPNRLRIQTIDSFNASLTKRLPILSQFGASPEIATEPYFLYLEAAQEFLSHLEENVEWSDAIAQLLTHMDNDLTKVQELLITMLAKRDQWLPHIAINANNPEFRDKLESFLNEIINETTSHLNEIFPDELTDELLTLIRFSESQRLKLNLLDDFNELNQHVQWNDTNWLTVAKFLLTSDNSWRKTVRVSEGFPAPGKDLYLKDMKERAIALITQLSEYEELRNSLEALRSLPSPRYTDSQWDILEALHLVLRICVAQLRIVFQKYGKIDYIENACAALHALGHEDSPTDIALALDYRIQHILVDEFQDTANTQYSLLQKLTAGWTPDDGRTLFVVGDPMQSIYRFREAEVGLFIRARKHGLGNVPLEPLTLSVNFRSKPEVVNWVNDHFKKVMPSYEDISTGAVSYSHSIANQNDLSLTSNDGVELHSFIGTDTFQIQANHIIQLIHQAKQSKPDGTIAILVRTRTHLKAIIPALKLANLSFRAIKIDPLSLRPTIQDLIALTRALLHPADRIAWLTILRAPWCGLTLTDLLTLSGNQQHVHLWKQIHSDTVINTLSQDGQIRLKRILPILKEKIAERRRLSLRQWIESTWIMLGGPACVDHVSDLEDTSAYFNLLEKLDVGSDITQLDSLTETIKQLYASPDNEADEKLQIMTIHNAKGLEFDTVILPHLERKPSGDDKQLLLWMERPRESQQSDLLIAPVNAIGTESDPIYDYIKRQIKMKAQYEDGRLLYVAATRAKEKLHILFSLEEKKESELKPTANSLLEKLWPAISTSIKPSSTLSDKTNNTLPLHSESSRIRRLSDNWVNPIQNQQSAGAITYHNQSSGFLLLDKKPSIIGTILHEILRQLATHEETWWESKSFKQKNEYIKSQLIQADMLSKDIDESINIILMGVKKTVTDERGKWILKSHHEAKSEFPITVNIQDEVKSLIIDRTFVDENNTRWIIDYKTSILSNTELEAFLNNKQKEHEKQLWQYHQAIRHIDSRPIRTGLYFPLLPAWKEWSFD